MNNRNLIWLKKNLSNIIFGGLILTIIFSSTAKEFVIRSIAFTGILNSSFKDKEGNKPAQSFVVIDNYGTKINTSELKGKVVFINFWASWCPPCRAEFPSMQKFYNQYKDQDNIVFLIINMDDDKSKGIEFLNSKNYKIPIHQLNSTISPDIYGGSLPTTVVLDKEGIIRYHHTGATDFTTEKFKENINQLLSQ